MLGTLSCAASNRPLIYMQHAADAAHRTGYYILITQACTGSYCKKTAVSIIFSVKQKGHSYENFVVHF